MRPRLPIKLHRAERTIAGWILTRSGPVLQASPFIALTLLAPPQFLEMSASIAPDANRLWSIIAIVSLWFALGHISIIALTARVNPKTDALVASLPLIFLVTAVARAGDLSWHPIAAIAVSWIVSAIFAVRIGRQAIWTIVFVALSVVTYAAFASIIVSDPVANARAIGPWVLVLVSLGTISLIVALALRSPLFGFGGAVAIVAIALFPTGDYRRPIAIDKAFEEPADPGSTFYDWLDKRADLADYRDANLPYPVIVVSAAGGGIYAAAETLGFLQTLQQACPNFAQHVFAASGISGGSIGLAYYAAEVADLEQRADVANCTRPQTVPTSPLASDHLTPLIGSLLYVDLIDALLPGNQFQMDRQDAFERSLLEAASEKQRAKLTTGFREIATSGGVAPYLALTSTDANSGSRYIFSQLSPQFWTMDADWFPGAIYDPYDYPEGDDVHLPPVTGRALTLLGAASTSARFPVISPTGLLRLSATDSRALVDGGYYDGSGIETAEDIVRLLERFDPDSQHRYGEMVVWEEGTIPVSIILIVLSGQPSTVAVYERLNQSRKERDATSSGLDPAATLLNVANTIGITALLRAVERRCPEETCSYGQTTSGGIILHAIDAPGMKLPFGWRMSAKQFDEVGAAILGTDCVARATAKEVMGVAPVEETTEVSSSVDEPAEEEVASGDEEVQPPQGLPLIPPDKGTFRDYNACALEMVASLFDLENDPLVYGIDGFRVDIP